MRRGRLRHRPEFQKRIITTNALGQSTVSYVDPGILIPAEATRISTETAQFILEARPGIESNTYRIIMWGCIWSINTCVLIERDRFLKIESNMNGYVNTTHVLSTEQEFIEGTPLNRPPA